MSVGNELDINTLSWVKSEIDETLKQARSALEAYVEDNDDASRLQFCFNYLHQVRGTLQMVELYGAAMAAEEMETLLQALIDDQVSNRNDAFEVLMRGILQLPDYLEHLLAGHKDIPVVLMPLLNDLRAARGEVLLSENALFSPDLDVEAPGTEIITTDISELARKLRHHYHLGLLGWFRNKDSEASLKRIGEVIEKLRQAAGEQEINRLLWVAGGLVESLLNGGLDSSVSIKLLLGQLDRQIKKIIDKGVTALSDEPPQELLKNLLYYVATSQSSDERTMEVKQAFRLEQVLPDTRSLEQARADLAGPNAELMGTVSSVVLEDLTRVKDALDVFMRQEQPDVEELRPLAATLQQMADTLGMMGLGIQRQILMEQIGVLNDIADRNQELGEFSLMDVAGAMLSLENSLKEASVARAANEEAEDIGEPGTAQIKLQEVEQQQLLNTVIEQAGQEMAHVKDALNDFSRNSASVEVLEGIPETLDQIRGSLSILNLDRAADLLQECTRYIREDLLAQRIVPSIEALEAFADAISSIEYYLESLAGKWGSPDTILDIAEKSLQTLEDYRSSGSDRSSDSLLIKPALHQPDIDVSMQLEVPADLQDEEDTLTDLQVPDEDTLQNLVTPPNVEDADAEVELADNEDTLNELPMLDIGTGETEAAAQPDSEVSANDITARDIELENLPLEQSFLESDGEQTRDDITATDIELESLELSQPLSTEPAEDTRNDITVPDLELGELATEASELAEDEDATRNDISIADLQLDDSELSEEHEDTLMLDTAAFEMDEAGIPSLELEGADAEPGPTELDAADTAATDTGLSLEGFDELLELEGLEQPEEAHREADAETGLDMNMPMAVPETGIPIHNKTDFKLNLPDESSDEIPRQLGQPPDLDIPESSVTDVSSSSISAVLELPEEIDEEIIEIFMEEAEEEHQNIVRLLAEWEADPENQEALTDMRRSFHTLKGSGRLVGAKDVGEFAWSFENMLNRVIDKTIDVKPVMFELLRQAAATLPVLFDRYRQHGQPEQHVFTLMGYAEELSHGKDVVLQTSIEETAKAADSAQLQSESAETMPHTAEPETTGEAGEAGSPAEAIEADEVAASAAAGEGTEQEQTLPTPLPDIDPVLLDIYRKEVATHLNTLRQYLADWQAKKGEHGPSDSLLRALHTLTGSSRTTGVTPVSELCGEFEKYINDLQNHQLLVSAEAVTLLNEIVQYIETCSTVLEQPGAVIADNSEFVRRLQELRAVAREEAPSMQLEVSTPAADVQATAAEPDQEYDEELLEIFLEEGEEIIEECDHTLTHWMENPEDNEDIEALQRQLHTLKGGARMAGVKEIGDLGHSIESMLTAVVEGHQPLSKPMFGIVQKGQDRLAQMLEQLKLHQPLVSGEDIVQEVDAVLGKGSAARHADSSSNQIVAEPLPEAAEEAASEPEMSTPAGERSSETVSSPTDSARPASEAPARPGAGPDEVASAEVAAISTDNVIDLVEQRSDAVTTPPEPDKEVAVPEQDRRKKPRVQHEQVRVRADLLDNLVNFAGEVSIYRSRMAQQTNTFRYNLRELDETVSRLRHQLREFEIETESQMQYRKEEAYGQSYEEFDPLEFDRFTHMQQLSRGMMESLNDLDSLRGILSNITRESETLLLQQSRVNTELQEGLMRTRMVPFSGVAPRLRRIVRQVSSELGKQVDLQLHGIEGELDRTVLDRIVPPLEHMLRNAVAHGIETPAQRKAAGKPETGRIALSFEQEGADILIHVSDDGAGINLAAIQKKAVEKGLLRPGDKVAKDELLNLIMESGFSTAEQITQIAGRGVGMDVVNNEIKKIGGLLNIDTEAGKGTIFTISLPLTLAISRALMVNVGEETYAIPLLSVQAVERISGSELQAIQSMEHPAYTWLDEEYPLMHLGSILGVSQPPVTVPEAKVSLLLVRSGEQRAAIQVENLLGSREIVVKSVGPQISTLRGITGATIMGDGQVVLIVDLGVLIRLVASMEGDEVVEIAVPQQEAEKRPLVMVVDDSITVRKVTGRLLERNDYEVVTAKDGVDALGQLQDIHPAIMLLDVEMPRMDGYELATNIRNNPELQDIPIIMITSRTADKHRQRALDIGVNIYMGKPYSEAELLENITTLITK